MARFRSRLPNITYYFRITRKAAKFINHSFETDDPELVEALTSHPHFGRDIVAVALDMASPPSPEAASHTCPECGKTFKSVHALHAHQGRTGHSAGAGKARHGRAE